MKEISLPIKLVVNSSLTSSIIYFNFQSFEIHMSQELYDILIEINDHNKICAILNKCNKSDHDPCPTIATAMGNISVGYNTSSHNWVASNSYKPSVYATSSSTGYPTFTIATTPIINNCTYAPTPWTTLPDDRKHKKIDTNTPKSIIYKILNFFKEKDDNIH